MCERNFEIEIKKEIENNDLIKTNLCSKKNKMNIKKRYNDLIFLHVFLKYRILANSMLLFINRNYFIRFTKINNNRIFLYILFMINEFTLFISRIKTIKYYFIHNYLLKHRFKSRFN